MSSDFRFNPTDYNKVIKPDSSNIAAIAFSNAKSPYPLAVAFKNGGTYAYAIQDIEKDGKPLGVAGASSIFWNLEFGGETKDKTKDNSVGAFFYKNVRGKCPFIKAANSNVFSAKDEE